MRNQVAAIQTRGWSNKKGVINYFFVQLIYLQIPSRAACRIDSVQGTANHDWKTKHSYLSNGTTINFCVQERFCSTNHLFNNSAKWNLMKKLVGDSWLKTAAKIQQKVFVEISVHSLFGFSELMGPVGFPRVFDGLLLKCPLFLTEAWWIAFKCKWN